MTAGGGVAAAGGNAEAASAGAASTSSFSPLPPTLLPPEPRYASAMMAPGKKRGEKGGERGVSRETKRTLFLALSPDKKARWKMKSEFHFFFNAFEEEKRKREDNCFSSLFSVEPEMPPRIASQASAASPEVVASGDALRAVRFR